MQRILLSPLLSPMRRAASQGSDMSVPPLSLGLARGRAASLTGRNGPSNNASMGMLPSSNETDGMESLSAIATSEINANAAETAEKLLVLRRAHDAFVRRVRVEQDVLETRAEGSGSGKVVRGFGEGVSPNRSVSRGSRSASGSRERSRGRDTSLERSKLGLMDWPEEDDRGRAGNAAGREQEGTERDEAASQKMREEDKAEEDARGRSRSRNRRRDDGSPLPPPEVELKPIPAPVPVVPTPIVSSASVATPTFIPQSHALVSIPESEEMSLPPSQAITPTSLSRPDSPPLLSTSTIIVNGADDDEGAYHHFDSRSVADMVCPQTLRFPSSWTKTSALHLLRQPAPLSPLQRRLRSPRSIYRPPLPSSPGNTDPPPTDLHPSSHPTMRFYPPLLREHLTSSSNSASRLSPTRHCRPSASAHLRTSLVLSWLRRRGRMRWSS